MSIPTKNQRSEWRRLASETMMISAVGEYTPAEFTTLLDAVDELESALERANSPARRFGEWKEFTRLEKDLDNVAIFVRRMAKALGPDHAISKAAMEYLKENDLIGSPLK